MQKKNSSETKKETIEYLKSHSRGSEIYRLSCFTTPNFLRRLTMVTDIFENFDPPSKKFLAMPLRSVWFLFYPYFLLSSFFFFYLYFPWQTLTIHRTAGKGEWIIILFVFQLHPLTNIYLVDQDLYHCYVSLCNNRHTL